MSRLIRHILHKQLQHAATHDLNSCEIFDYRDGKNVLNWHLLYLFSVE